MTIYGLINGDRMDFEKVDHLVERLRNDNPPVTSFMTFFSLERGVVQAITKELETNDTVIDFHFINSGLGDDEVQAIAEMLKKNNTVAHIQLNGNDITDVGAQALAKALEINVILTIINLELNQIKDVEILAAIRNATARNERMPEVIAEKLLPSDSLAKFAPPSLYDIAYSDNLFSTDDKINLNDNERRCLSNPIAASKVVEILLKKIKEVYSDRAGSSKLASEGGAGAGAGAGTGTGTGFSSAVPVAKMRGQDSFDCSVASVDTDASDVGIRDWINRSINRSIEADFSNTSLGMKQLPGMVNPGAEASGVEENWFSGDDFSDFGSDADADCSVAGDVIKEWHTLDVPSDKDEGKEKRGGAMAPSFAPATAEAAAGPRGNTRG